MLKTSLLKKNILLPFFLTSHLFFCIASFAKDSSDSISLPRAMDFSSQIVFRTIPLGFAVSGTVGYSHLLWGDPSSKDAFMYGYARGKAKVQSSLFVNSLDLALEVAPIAPLLLVVGHSESHRSKDFSGIDCLNNTCKGRIQRNYFQAAAIYGYGPAFMGGSARITSNNTPGAFKYFYDEAASLIAKSGGDTFREWDAFLGYKIDENQKLGYFANLTEMTGSTESSSTHALFYSYTHGVFNYSGGAGFYQSDLQARSATFFVSAKWVGKKAIGLF